MHRRGRTKRGSKIHNMGVSRSENTDIHQLRNAPPGGCTHPPIQPTQLLRKFLESFIPVAPYGGIPRRGRYGDVPRVVSLEQVGQKVLLVVR